ncbi:MAG: hypothetical protein ABW104_20125 [Candidatus Thiodiazotropha sp. 6PLUC2]
MTIEAIFYKIRNQPLEWSGQLIFFLGSMSALVICSSQSFSTMMRASEGSAFYSKVFFFFSFLQTKPILA